MSGKVLAMLPKRGEARSPERAELANAIAQAAQIEAAYDAALDAEQRGQEVLNNALAAYAKAEGAVNSAKAAETRAITDGARSGQAVAPGKSLREARAALVDAQDNLDNAREAFATLQAARQQAEAQRGRAESPLHSAAAAVLQPAADKLVAEIEAAQRDLVQKRLTLRWLVKARLLTNVEPATKILMRVCLPDLDELFGGNDPTGWPREWETPANQTWANALEELKRNPDAPLPGAA